MWDGVSVHHNGAGPSTVRFTLNGAINMFKDLNKWFDSGNASMRNPLHVPVRPQQHNLQQQKLSSWFLPRTSIPTVDLTGGESGSTLNHKNRLPKRKVQQRKKRHDTNKFKRNNGNKNRPRQTPKVYVRQQVSYAFQIETCLLNVNWTLNITPFKKLEEEARQHFGDPRKNWSSGNSKKSYTYLLLDPRITRNLPARPVNKNVQWITFIKSIFYVGKGKSERPYKHLTEALPLWDNYKRSEDKKLQRILDIWNSNMGVICLQVFHNVIPVEAYTYEAAMIDALGLKNLTNLVSGSYKGVVESWTEKEQRMLGIYLLYKAMASYIIEGERQLHPDDI